MSIVTERESHNLSSAYSIKSESELSFESEDFQGYVDNKRSNDRSPSKNSTLVSDSLDESFETTQEIANTDNSFKDLPSSRKRRRESSASEESSEASSCSVSPEISYGGSPVKYKLWKVDGTLLVIKKSMSSTPRRRSQKCTDQDISIILDSDSDELTIFDPAEKVGNKIVQPVKSERRYSGITETLKREEVSLKMKLRRSTEQSDYKIERNLDNEESKCRISNRSNKGTPKKCGTADCTEDHSYAGLRKSVSVKTPNKVNTSQINSPNTPVGRRTRKNSKNFINETEIVSLHNKENKLKYDSTDDENDSVSSRERGARKVSLKQEFMSLHNKENRLKLDSTDDDNDSVSSRERGAKKLSMKQEFGTPAKQSKRLEEVSTPSSGRTRRNTRLVNYNYDLLENITESNEVKKKDETPVKNDVSVTPRSARLKKSTRSLSYEYYDTKSPQKNDTETKNETENVDSRGRGRKKVSAKSNTETPQKQIKKLEEISTPSSTRPRRNSRLVNYNYDGLEAVATRENKDNESDGNIDEEGVVSRRRATRRVLSKEGSATPQKQMKILEEPMTPKRTPRRTAAQKLGEATPKRTPRRSTIKQLENELPTTPTTATRKISKATTPSIKSGNLTPSMSRRTANVGKPKTILEEARARLHVSAVPKSLPCREEEFNDIFEFLQRKLLDKNSGCIYISGVPGTGKTATVNEAIRCLEKLAVKGDLEKFDFIEINGMKLSEPRQAYVQIMKQINGQTATWEQAYQILEKRFTQSTAKRPMTLLLVDELDLLCNKRQDVVYNLLDWPAKANAQLVVITIANTMDLPERVLMGRVTSRLGLTRLTFQPYNHKQLQEIVMARLKDSDAFRSEAVQLVARKVAAVSGDARRALDICRRATEIAELNSGKIVTMQDVNQALTEMIASAKVQAIKHCSEMERIFLQAVCAEVARTGVEETGFYNVYRQLEALCSFEGLKVPNITQALAICGRLGGNRLLICEHSRNDTQQRILLNVSPDDIHFAMQTINVS